MWNTVSSSGVKTYSHYAHIYQQNTRYYLFLIFILGHHGHILKCTTRTCPAQRVLKKDRPQSSASCPQRAGTSGTSGRCSFLAGPESAPARSLIPSPWILRRLSSLRPPLRTAFQLHPPLRLAAGSSVLLSPVPLDAHTAICPFTPHEGHGAASNSGLA